MNGEFQRLDGTTTRFAYTARGRFGPWDGESWRKYIEWSKLSQLAEVLSDGILCPSLVDVDGDEDWNRNINEGHFTRFFWDLAYLRKKIPEGTEFNLLAVARNPTEDPANWQPQPDFVYLGSDLIEAATGVSAVTNCGGFPDVFDNSEISRLGLIREWQRAVEIQSALAKAHPEEPHARCDVWTIWRHAPARSSNSGDN